uniref:Uncharacterized protein n=1 Tax=Anguilla anguilla TaxID=7936 RepID=A0A0E9VDX9_ANGAN
MIIMCVTLGKVQVPDCF